MTQRFENNDHHRQVGDHGAHHLPFHTQFHSMGQHDAFAAFKHDARHADHLHKHGILPGLEVTGDTNHHHHHKSQHHHHHEQSPHHHHHQEQAPHHHGRGGHHGGGEEGGEERPGKHARDRNEGDLKKVSDDGSGMSKEEKEKYLFGRLTAKDGLNLTPKQAAGAIGSLEGESPDLYAGRVNHKNEHDLGFVNWIGSRKHDLERFAKSQGKDATDFKTQVDFMQKELQGPEHRALDALRKANSVREAARAFTNRYERPGIPHLKARMDNAEVAYERANKLGWHESRAEDTQAEA